MDVHINKNKEQVQSLTLEDEKIFINYFLPNCVSQLMADRRGHFTKGAQHLYLRAIIIYTNTAATLFSKVLNTRS